MAMDRLMKRLLIFIRELNALCFFGGLLILLLISTFFFHLTVRQSRYDLCMLIVINFSQFYAVNIPLLKLEKYLWTLHICNQKFCLKLEVLFKFFFLNCPSFPQKMNFGHSTPNGANFF